jgi:hypothetical protein
MCSNIFGCTQLGQEKPLVCEAGIAFKNYLINQRAYFVVDIEQLNTEKFTYYCGLLLVLATHTSNKELTTDTSGRISTLDQVMADTTGFADHND